MSWRTSIARLQYSRHSRDPPRHTRSGWAVLCPGPAALPAALACPAGPLHGWLSGCCSWALRPAACCSCSEIRWGSRTDVPAGSTATDWQLTGNCLAELREGRGGGGERVPPPPLSHWRPADRPLLAATGGPHSLRTAASLCGAGSAAASCIRSSTLHHATLMSEGSTPSGGATDWLLCEPSQGPTEP
jgi:hypothetical protein